MTDAAPDPTASAVADAGASVAVRRLLPARRARDLLGGFLPLLGRLRVRLEDASGGVVASADGADPDADAATGFVEVARWSLPGAEEARLRVAPAPAGAAEAALVELLRRTVFDALEAALARRALAAETLERYREIHLLYRVGEALAGTLDAHEVPARVLAEARAVIDADAGAVWTAPDADAGRVGADAAGADAVDPTVGVTTGDAAAALAATLAALADPTRSAVLGAEGAWGPRLWAPLLSGGALRGGVLLARAPGRHEFPAGDAKLLAALATQAAAFLDVARLHRRAVAQERMERELQLAFEMQSRLMPGALDVPPGWDVAAHWSPAREVSGDFYDVLDVGDAFGVVVADVADKGVPAALFMAVVRSLLRASVSPDRSPADAVALANRLACRDAADGTFVTLWYGQFDAAGGLRYVNAGHNPPLLRRADGRVERLGRTGILVGWDPEVPFGEAAVRLGDGDLLVGYTDGVTEARAPDGAEYGEARLLEVVAAADVPGAPAAAVLEAVRTDLARFIGDAEPHDDVTLVLVRRTAAPAG